MLFVNHSTCQAFLNVSPEEVLSWPNTAPFGRDIAARSFPTLFLCRCSSISYHIVVSPKLLTIQIALEDIYT